MLTYTMPDSGSVKPGRSEGVAAVGGQRLALQRVGGLKHEAGLLAQQARSAAADGQAGWTERAAALVSCPSADAAAPAGILQGAPSPGAVTHR